ncbi:lipid A export permease/ATP-binding protein MsbA [Desulfuromonas acetoxidans]|uniref:ABC transporter related n=1 Tax=Desulfuromonas acetoxidans (strain DSM 684 / 11070) TaxID=281689 RepID=Q1K138_DESA6|nr:lipid A export permease/ATP-binding protein MsbA [Desulfuromonas acetoxidans]EAT16170.1 ABC transporter related [Desulfuromonas acetoxidans DSM 684]
MAGHNMQVYRRLLNYSRPYVRRIALAMIASLGVAGTDVAIAKLVQPLVDYVLAAQNMTLVNLVPLVVIGLATIKGVSRYIQEYFMKTAGQMVVQDLRNSLYCHSLDLSMRYYSKNSVGSMVSRILNDVNMLQKSAADELVTVVREGLTLIGLVGLLFYNDWRLAIVAFTVLPVAVVPASQIGRRIKKYVRKSLTNMSTLTGILQESFSGIKVVKAFGTETAEKEKFNRENWNFYLRMRKVIRYDSATAPIMEVLASFGAAGVLWYGIQRVMEGAITQGELLSFIAAMGMMYGPMKRLIKTNNVIQKAVGAAERVFEMLDLKPDLTDRDDAIELPRCRGHVVFNKVDFAYEDEPVLRGFSADVPPGKMIAVVGASGAGKSTLIGLLARFYDPVAGQILIDGYDIASVTQSSLKNQIALVDQETFLFHDTLYNNIRYSNVNATDAEVEEAAQLAFADEFIREMPQGYETVIGDRGVRLSGGQRQRICIARAILRDAPILLLDEATSALDTESETVVQKALANLMKERTTFVIAHRLSTIMHADEILVLSEGVLVEQGRHDELLAAGGVYRRLHDMQFEDRR